MPRKRKHSPKKTEAPAAIQNGTASEASPQDLLPCAPPSSMINELTESHARQEAAETGGLEEGTLLEQRPLKRASVLHLPTNLHSPTPSGSVPPWRSTTPDFAAGAAGPQPAGRQLDHIPATTTPLLRAVQANPQSEEQSDAERRNASFDAYQHLEIKGQDRREFTEDPARRATSTTAADHREPLDGAINAEEIAGRGAANAKELRQIAEATKATAVTRAATRPASTKKP